MSEIVLTVLGHIPAKKNEYSVGQNNIYIPDHVIVRLRDIERQLRKAWGMRLPLRHPDIEFHWTVCSDGKDKDNAWQTLQDCLVRAGVLVNDDIRNLNGEISLKRAVVDATLSPEQEVARIILRGGGADV